MYIYICMYTHIYIYIYIWVNYNDLTATSLEWWLVIVLSPNGRKVEDSEIYGSLPMYIFVHIYIYIYVYITGVIISYGYSPFTILGCTPGFTLQIFGILIHGGNPARRRHGTAYTCIHAQIHIFILETYFFAHIAVCVVHISIHKSQQQQ